MAERQGNKWTHDEEVELLGEVACGKTTEEIAANLGRTVGGIRARKLKIARQLMTENQLSIEDASQAVGMSVGDVHRSIMISESMKKKEPEDTNISLLREIRDLLKSQNNVKAATIPRNLNDFVIRL